MEQHAQQANMTYADSPWRTTCPTCGEDCGALESFRQATRSEPMRSFGWQGGCFACGGMLGAFVFTCDKPTTEILGLFA